MIRPGLAILACWIVSGLAFSQTPETRAPIAENPTVELQGKIQSIQLSPGQGTPFLVVASGGTATRVQLGSMRYLMERNFNPRAGDEVIVKGYKTATEIVASSVTLPAQGTVLQLRDDNGRPLWQGGRFGRSSGGRGWGAKR